MKTRLLVLSMLTAATLLTTAATTRACGGCDFGFGYGLLYNSLQYRVPYFAAHPPVYYSHPVPRTYGYSPFAYPPNVMTPEVVEHVQPQEIINPYVPKGEASPALAPADRAAAVQARPEPLVIVNPFVVNGSAVAKSDLR